MAGERPSPEEVERLTVANTSRRQAFEQAHPSRFQTIQDKPGAGRTPAQSYHLMGNSDRPTNLWGQQELPGMEHPGTVSTPPRWEDLAPKQHDRILKAAAKWGVTPESAHRSLASQVDSAYEHDKGHHESFYTAEGTFDFEDENSGNLIPGTMTPRSLLKSSAKEGGATFHEQAVANAITSPKQKFAAMPKTGVNAGKVVYPNDVQASHAIREARRDVPIEDIKAAPGVGGMHNRVQAAAKVIRDIDAGASVREAWKPGPKTGPYHNSWVDPEGPSQFWVSDTHSGGAAFAPHLSKPEQDEYMGIAGIHSLHDYIARNVMKERGLNSLSNMQSAQWNEEKRQKKTNYGDKHLVSGNAKSAATKKSETLPGQQEMF